MIYLESEVGQLERKLNEAAARIAYLEQQAFEERNELSDRVEDLERKLKALDHGAAEPLEYKIRRRIEVSK